MNTFVLNLDSAIPGSGWILANSPVFVSDHHPGLERTRHVRKSPLGANSIHRVITLVRGVDAQAHLAADHKTINLGSALTIKYSSFFLINGNISYS
jgi:hypothetical protein